MIPIQGWLKQTLIDFPGEIASVIFLRGCNFRCPYCHNPDLMTMPGREYEALFSEEEVLAHLEFRRGMLDGICITGGEPLLYGELPGFISRVKDAGFKVKIDTNGSMPDVLDVLCGDGLIDYAALDIKAPRKRYAETARPVAGCVDPTDAVERSIRILQRNRIDYEFRTTAVPGLITLEDFADIADWLGSGRRFVIQQFRPGNNLDPVFAARRPTDPAFLLEAKKLLDDKFEKTEIRGFAFTER